MLVIKRIRLRLRLQESIKAQQLVDLLSDSTQPDKF